MRLGCARCAPDVPAFLRRLGLRILWRGPLLLPRPGPGGRTITGTPSVRGGGNVGIRPEKEATVAELKEKFGRARSVVFMDNKGLTVAQATKLRKKAREAGVEYRVAKNTLIRIAAQQSQASGVEELSPLLEGPTSFALGYEDPVAPAKVISDFIREGKITTLELKGGWLEGRALDVAGIKALADLPSREVLLGKVLGGMQGPMYGFAGSLAAVLRQFAYAVEALRQQREAAGAQG